MKRLVHILSIITAILFSTNLIAQPDFGGALNFDGVDDRVTLDPFSLPDGFTIEMWVNPTDINTNHAFISRSFLLSGAVKNNFVIGFFNDGLHVGLYQDSYEEPNTEWTGFKHVAVSVQKLGSALTNIKVYTNGTLLWERDLSSEIQTGFPSVEWVIGQQFGAILSSINLFEGDIDEVRIWGEARTQTQIQENFTRTLNGDETNLIVYYNLDEGVPNGENTSVTTVFDQTTLGVNGTLLNFGLTGIGSNYTNTFLNNVGSWSKSDYYDLNANATWDESNLMAQSAGGDMVAVNSQAEQSFLATSTVGPYWMGLFQNFNSPDYSEPDGGWEWTTGEYLSYINWGLNEPNGFEGENHGNMQSDFNWNDLDGSSALPVVLEFPQIVADYPFNGNANDESGNGFDLDENNFVLLGKDRFANTDNAYTFDGIDDYLNVFDQIIPTEGDFSVSVWAKYLGPAFEYREIISQSGDFGVGFYIGQSASGEIRAGDQWEDTGVTFPTDGLWHHYVVVKTDLNTILYLDNNPTVGPGMANPSASTPEFRVGRQYGGPGEYFEGNIDDIKVYHRALEPGDIGALYEIGNWPAPTTPSSFISYPLNTSEIQLEWSDVENETSYIIERSPDRITYNFLTTVGADVTAYTDSGLPSNTLYWYRIRSQNAQGDSPNYVTENVTFSTSLSTNFNFNKSFGGSGWDYAHGIAAEDQGNFYVFGRYNTQIDFDGTILNSSNTNNQNSLFLTKFDKDGNTIWARTVDPDNHVVPRDVTVTDDGSVYVTGYFWGNMGFAGSTLTSTPETYSVYVLKYDANGNEIWARTVSSSSYSVGRTLGSDSQGNIYIGGRLPTAGATFAGNTVTGPGSMLLKYDQNGNEIWIAHAPVITSQPEGWVTDITSMDINDNGIYVTGDLYGITDFGNGVSITVGEEGDLFIAKYDFNGNAQWVQSGGGTDHDLGNDITLDANSNIYVTGQFRSSSFDAPGISLGNNGTGNTDIVVLKYDQNGTLIWGQNHGNWPNDHPYSITTDGDNIYVTGYKSKRPVDFGGISVDNGSFWLAKYLSDGTVEWVEELEGEIWGYELDYHNGLLYMAGTMEYHANFGSFQTQTNNLSRDLHIGTITTGGAPTGDLVAHWPVNSIDGFNDVSGNSNHMGDEGSGLSGSGTDRFKNIPETFEFNGSNYGVARASNHPTGNFTGTYSFWEYHTVDHIGRFISVGTNGATDLSAVRIFSGFYEYQNGQDVATFSPMAPLNRWNHVVLVRDGDNVTLWLNGEQYETITMISQGLASTDIFLGQSGDGEFFQGKMDDIRIFTYAISETEILNLFNEGVDTNVQIAWLEPSLVTPEDQVTIYYNAERGNKALMGLDSVYIHVGAVVGIDPIYEWGQYVLDAEMTNAYGNIWSYTLSPSTRDVFNVPANGIIQRLGMIFFSEDAPSFGKGTPSEYGDFPGGRVEDGTYWTPGDIYLNLVNPTPLELDSLTLVVLYQALDGDNWLDNSGWLTGPVDTWYGITVSGGRVVDVYLDNNNMTGVLPTAIGRLDACAGFSATGNSISGSIPTEVGDMAAMQWLYLDANQLTGNIPPEVGNLSNLNGLYLNENQLTGTIPVEIGNLTGLTSLSLYTNLLIGSIPNELQNLTNLQYLDLEDNDLNGLIPSFIGTNLTGLVELWLSDNSFSGSIPVELGNLFNLEILYLGSNDLTGSIPPELGNLSALRILNLSSNNLMGEIPTELGNLFNLSTLSLTDNSLRGAIPSSFGSLSFLTNMYIGFNLLTDIPDLSSTSIDELYIWYNKFTMEDILLNLGLPSVYEYDPQELVGEPQNRFVANGSDYQFSLDFDRNVTGSTYEWFWEGVSIITVNGPDIFFMPADNTHTGTWYVTITNEALPGLVLQTEDIYIQVQDICASNATDAADTRIDRVVFGDLDNTSDLTTTQCATYTNFTQYSATVYPGQSVTGGLTMGTCNGEWDKMGVIYIDWSQDGNFDDATERVLWTTDPTNITEFQSGTYTVPSDAAFGTYLMRVIAQETTDLNTITGCGSYEFGETEDYTVNVIDATADLILELVDVTPNSIFGVSGIQSGNDIAITTNIGNAGLVEVVDLVRGVGYYLSEDQILSGDDIEIGVSGITSLPGGEVITLADEIVTIPGNTSPGAYYLIAEADPDGALNDPDLSDNIDVTPLPITVTAPPDAEDPVVALQNPPSSYILGSGGVTLRASITDNFGIATVIFAYARMSEITDDFDDTQYTVRVPEEESSSVYAWTLEDSEFDDIGIQYFFGATDVYGNIGSSTPFPARISVEFSDGSINLGSIQAVSNSADPQETDYRIFSVPVRSATIGSVLGLSSTDKSEWRVWQYNGGNSELTGTSASLTIGKGYWLIYQNSAGLNPNFGGIAVDASNNNPFILNLSSGFNLIGNPYNFPISWQQVVDHNVNQGIISSASDVSGLTFYQGGFNEVGYTTLNPTEGAFVSSNEPFSLEVPFSSQTTRMGATARRFNHSLDDDRWEVGINLSNENTFYNVASVGMHPNAEEGRDKHDLQAMPYLFRYLEFNSSNELLTERISKDFVNTKEEHIWEFEAVTTFDPSEAELSWDNSYFGDNDRQLYLYDEQEERIINMREQTSYHFYLHGKQSFRIMYGSPEFIESSLKPDRFTLGHAYPNPFADLTRIPFSLPDDQDMYKVRLEVYNSIGELVKVLADDTYVSGFYAADWDGTNVHGQQVSEGIYIYKLSIAHEEGSEDLTGKLMYGRE